MISWIKYSPISLREANNNLTDLSGPSFEFASEKRLNIGGSILSFKAPRRSFLGTTTKMYDTGSNDALSMDVFRPQTSSFLLSQNWSSKVIFVRQWSHNGAWFSGSQGCSQLTVVLKKRTTGKEFHNANFLHAKSFEYALCDDLDNMYGGREDEGRPKHQAPVSWQPQNSLPVPSVKYHISSAAHTDKRFSFAVSEGIFCYFNLSFFGADIIQIHVDELAEKIFGSVRFEPSPELQARLDEIKNAPEGLQTLSPTMAPLKWPITKEGYENPTLRDEAALKSL